MTDDEKQEQPKPEVELTDLEDQGDSKGAGAQDIVLWGALSSAGGFSRPSKVDGSQ